LSLLDFIREDTTYEGIRRRVLATGVEHPWVALYYSFRASQCIAEDRPECTDEVISEWSEFTLDPAARLQQPSYIVSLLRGVLEGGDLRLFHPLVSEAPAEAGNPLTNLRGNPVIRKQLLGRLRDFISNHRNTQLAAGARLYVTLFGKDLRSRLQKTYDEVAHADLQNNYYDHWFALYRSLRFCGDFEVNLLAYQPVTVVQYVEHEERDRAEYSSVENRRGLLYATLSYLIQKGQLTSPTMIQLISERVGAFRSAAVVLARLRMFRVGYPESRIPPEAAGAVAHNILGAVYSSERTAAGQLLTFVANEPILAASISSVPSLLAHLLALVAPTLVPDDYAWVLGAFDLHATPEYREALPLFCFALSYEYGSTQALIPLLGARCSVPPVGNGGAPFATVHQYFTRILEHLAQGQAGGDLWHGLEYMIDEGYAVFLEAFWAFWEGSHETVRRALEPLHHLIDRRYSLSTPEGRIRF
jgi:hypothetical protein